MCRRQSTVSMMFLCLRVCVCVYACVCVLCMPFFVITAHLLRFSFFFLQSPENRSVAFTNIKLNNKKKKVKQIPSKCLPVVCDSTLMKTDQLLFFFALLSDISARSSYSHLPLLFPRICTSFTIFAVPVDTAHIYLSTSITVRVSIFSLCVCVHSLVTFDACSRP